MLKRVGSPARQLGALMYKIILCNTPWMHKNLTCIVLMMSLTLSCNSFGEVGASQDWFWSTDAEDDGFHFAMTRNDSEHLLGQFCYFESESCLYLLDIDITCDNEQEYPGLINSDIGSFTVTLTCYSGNRFIISEFDDIDRAVLESTKIGLVVPLDDDNFKVSRFSLMGSNETIETMHEKSNQIISKKPKPSSQIL